MRRRGVCGRDRVDELHQRGESTDQNRFGDGLRDLLDPKLRSDGVEKLGGSASGRSSNPRSR
jgi:hypothetical protein